MIFLICEECSEAVELTDYFVHATAHGMTAGDAIAVIDASLQTDRLRQEVAA